MVHGCTWLRDPVPSTARVRYFRRFYTRIIPTICIIIARDCSSVEIGILYITSGSPHEFKVRIGERHANGSECTKGPASVETDSIGDAKDTLKHGKLEGISCIVQWKRGEGRANVISGGNALGA